MLAKIRNYAYLKVKIFSNFRVHSADNNIVDTRPNIFEYVNYRDYLKDFYKHEKSANPNFSHRYFVKRAGFSSPVQLYRVTEGKRNLTRESIHKFVQGLGLGKREQQYFEILVSFNQAKGPEAKRYYLELLNNMRKEKVGTPLDEGKFEYLSKWFYPAIRELVYLQDFHDDPEWIKRVLKNRVNIKEEIGRASCRERV